MCPAVLHGVQYLIDTVHLDETGRHAKVVGEGLDKIGFIADRALRRCAERGRSFERQDDQISILLDGFDRPVLNDIGRLWRGIASRGA